MSIVDPISDMLTRIRNAYAIGKECVEFDSSKAKTAILAILKSNGYVDTYAIKDGKTNVVLGYEGEKPNINKIERVSKPGRRVYVKKDEIPRVLSGMGIVVVSTSKGLMAGDEARKSGLGGELICRVY